MVGAQRSVGKPLTCELHICDEHGEEVPVGESTIMDGGGTFEYYKDEGKTNDSRHQGLVNLGRRRLLGRRWLPVPDGPQTLHDHFRRGQRIPASRERSDHPRRRGGCGRVWRTEPRLRRRSEGVVQLRDTSMATPEMEVELLDYCRSQLSSIKCPQYRLPR